MGVKIKGKPGLYTGKVFTSLNFPSWTPARINTDTVRGEGGGMEGLRDH